MGSIIKVVIGVVIGVVGFWVLERYVMDDGQKAGQYSEFNQQATLAKEDEAVDKNKSVADSQDESEAVKIESLTSELESLKRQVEVKNQELQASKLESKRLNAILKGDGTSVDGLTADQNNSKNSRSDQNKFEGIPESHHQLLTRPASMPKATHELHDDLVNEQEDISWATMKEQQINHFLMTYKDNGQYIIHKVECRSTLCEIIGTEHPSERDVWAEVTGQMRNQAWWEFTGTHTTSSSDSSGNLLFVTILQRVRGSEKAS